jgi:hypothetical protein
VSPLRARDAADDLQESMERMHRVNEEYEQMMRGEQNGRQ